MISQYWDLNPGGGGVVLEWWFMSEYHFQSVPWSQGALYDNITYERKDGINYRMLCLSVYSLCCPSLYLTYLLKFSIATCISTHFSHVLLVLVRLVFHCCGGWDSLPVHPHLWVMVLVAAWIICRIHCGGRDFASCSYGWPLWNLQVDPCLAGLQQGPA